MPFPPHYYVPVLRWKRGEWVALRELTSDVKARLTPLVEIPPKHINSWSGDGDSDTTIFNDTAEELCKSWGTQPLFLDTGLIAEPNRSANALRHFGSHAHRAGVPIIPVTGLRRAEVIQRAVMTVARTAKAGIALRLLLKDLADPDLGSKIDGLCAFLEEKPEALHLVLDIQLLADHVPHYVDLCKKVPHWSSWRNIILIAGAFPKDLSAFAVGIHELQRGEWVRWRNQIWQGTSLSRKPIYGDYATQHALFAEPPARANFSASIRYTSHDNWVIMRGEGVFSDGSPGFAQWPANAVLLSARSEFCGDSFSFGDHYIHTMSLQTEKTGSAETWLRAGINHHLTFVVQQLAGLRDAKGTS